MRNSFKLFGLFALSIRRSFAVSDTLDVLAVRLLRDVFNQALAWNVWSWIATALEIKEPRPGPGNGPPSIVRTRVSLAELCCVCHVVGVQSGSIWIMGCFDAMHAGMILHERERESVVGRS